MLDDQPVPSAAHQIRLRGPWNYELLAQTELAADGCLLRRPLPAVPREGVLKIPGDWGPVLGSEFFGRVAFRRRFGRPTNLSPATRLFLVLEGIDAFGEIWLNQHHLGSIPRGVFTARFPIRSALEPRNTLMIEVDCPAMSREQAERWRPPGRAGQAGGLFGHVVLEIAPITSAR